MGSFLQLEGIVPLGVIKQREACEKCRGGRPSCFCYLRNYLFREIGTQFWGPVADVASELQQVKQSLDEFDPEEWSRHTDTNFLGSKLKSSIRSMVPLDTSLTCPPELLTNAWLKLFEILSHLDLLPHGPVPHDVPIRTLHLGECPGGFVSATNHFIKTRMHTNQLGTPQWEWRAVTLCPYHEMNDPHTMLDQDQFYRETYGNWLRGFDGTGNLMRPQNFNQILQELGGQNMKFNLVTADGSFDVQHDPGRQEEYLFPLLLSEILLALGLLLPEGSFVIKMYSILCPCSVGLVGLIANSFSECWVAKPLMSKPGNSEVYVVGKGFKGVSSSLFEMLRPHIGRSVLISHKADKASPGEGQSEGVYFLPEMSLSNGFLKGIRKLVRAVAERQIVEIKKNKKKYLKKIGCVFPSASQPPPSPDSSPADDVPPPQANATDEDEEEDVIPIQRKIDLASEWIKNHQLTWLKPQDLILPNGTIFGKTFLTGSELESCRGEILAEETPDHQAPTSQDLSRDGEKPAKQARLDPKKSKKALNRLVWDQIQIERCQAFTVSPTGRQFSLTALGYASKYKNIPLAAWNCPDWALNITANAAKPGPMWHNLASSEGTLADLIKMVTHMLAEYTSPPAKDASPGSSSELQHFLVTYGRFYDNAPTMKVYRISSSPYFKTKTFHNLIKLRSILPQILPPIFWYDFASFPALFRPANSELEDTNAAKAPFVSPLMHPSAYEIALWLLSSGRRPGVEAQPFWVEISMAQPILMNGPIFGYPMSLPLRQCCCPGFILDIGPQPQGASSSSTSVQKSQSPEADQDMEGPGGHPQVVSAPGLHNWENVRESVCRLIPTRGVRIIMIDVLTNDERAELVQKEIDFVRRLLRALRVALRLASERSVPTDRRQASVDILLVIPTLSTRLLGSLILILATIFKSINLFSPPFQSGITQRKYLHLRNLRGGSAAEAGKLPPIESVRAIINKVIAVSSEVPRALAQRGNAAAAAKANTIQRSLHYLLPPIFFAHPPFAALIREANEACGVGYLAALEALVEACLHLKEAAANAQLRIVSTEVRELFGLPRSDRLPENPDGVPQADESMEEGECLVTMDEYLTIWRTAACANALRAARRLSRLFAMAKLFNEGFSTLDAWLTEAQGMDGAANSDSNPQARDERAAMETARSFEELLRIDFGPYGPRGLPSSSLPSLTLESYIRKAELIGMDPEMDEIKNYSCWTEWGWPWLGRITSDREYRRELHELFDFVKPVGPSDRDSKKQLAKVQAKFAEKPETLAHMLSRLLTTIPPT